MDDAMEEEGHRSGTVKRAKRLLGVVSAKSVNANGGWTWFLAPLGDILPPTTTTTSTSFSTSDTSLTSTSLGNTNGYSATAPTPFEEDAIREVVEESEEVEVAQVVLTRTPEDVRVREDACEPGEEENLSVIDGTLPPDDEGYL
jgi:hypothetical protein